MQNKGFIKVFAVLLTLVCIFYLSFSFVTNRYYKQAKVYAEGDPMRESQYLDSLATKKVWLGYTLKESRVYEVNLGLDLKGGMNVILEVNVADVLKSLSDNNTNPNFNQAIATTQARQTKSQKDFISLFAEEYRKLDPGARLSGIFSTPGLKGRVTLQSSDAEVEAVLREELKSAIDNSFNVLRNRIDKFGVVAPNIQRLETDGRILVELPGIKEPARVRKLLQGSANLEFWETYELQEIYQQLIAVNTALREMTRQEVDTEATAQTVVQETPVQAVDTVKTAADELLSQITASTQDSLQLQNTEAEWKKNNPLFAVLSLSQSGNQINKGPAVGMANYRDTATVNRYLNMRAVKELLPRNVFFRWSVKSIDKEEEYYQLIALKSTTRDGKAPLEGDVVIGARADFDSQGRGSGSVVSMSMNQEGAKKWARLTKENIGRCIAIVLDDQVYSFPVVNDEITGGNSQISGHFTVEEAKDLENVLKSGKMAASVRIVQEDIIGPSLGQEAISKGLVSFLVALVVLMLYLVVMYGVKPGLIANGALLFNLFFTMGVLASFHAVLTLSGIAGIVLALAIAVDANVLIYERIKEEIRGGKATRKAVEEGYKKAFSAIFDANLTSIITGVILFYFGTGPIRGFATTLIIGIIVSFFTAVFMTRIIYESRMAKGKLLDLKFTTSLSKNFLVNPTFEFIDRRKLLYGITIAMCVLSIGFLVTRGLNQGIDFTGGRNYIVQFDQPVSTEEVRDMVDKQFEGETPNVINIGSAEKVRISTNYKIQDQSETIDDEIIGKVYEGVKPLLKAGTTLEKFSSDHVLSSQKVGPSIAEDIKRGAFLAVIFAVIAISLYILLRFRDISYSVGSVVALSMDALIILGIYAIFWGILPFSMEVDQTFIGAILTVLGYSINDKVVIFDRVREYTHLYPKQDKKTLFNQALNSTLDRTFNTSVSTLFVLIIIFIFAGDTIRSFSFAMIIGVIGGTLSSLFISSPLAFELQQRKQEKLAKLTKANK